MGWRCAVCSTGRGRGGAMCVVWWWKVLESRGRGGVRHGGVGGRGGAAIASQATCTAIARGLGKRRHRVGYVRAVQGLCPPPGRSRVGVVHRGVMLCAWAALPSGLLRPCLAHPSCSLYSLTLATHSSIRALARVQWRAAAGCSCTFAGLRAGGGAVRRRASRR